MAPARLAFMPRLSEPSPYVEFDRKQWRALRKSTPLVLTEEELIGLRGLGEQIDLTEVAEVYLPLARLIHLQVAARQRLFAATATFLGDQHPDRLVPFVIGVAGSVAVGKSTTARVLQALLARWDHHPRVDLVTTDGFLYPNAELSRRNIMHRKGFPESYNRRGLLRFVTEVKRARGKSPRRCTRTCCTTSSRTRNMLYSNPISSFLRA
ncbi:Probable pantothenate kinase CoaA [Mycobacteroides abscessus]|nr:Probable pantothenate kinase CoaA [Mycobacteroides abscessus]